MKTIVDSWHSGITGVRLAGQFADYAHLLLEDEVEDIDHLESVAEVVAVGGPTAFMICAHGL